MELLTTEECKEIVKNSLKHAKKEDVSIIDYIVTRCTEELLGFMGEYYQLAIVAKDNLTNNNLNLTYFVKALPITNEMHRQECERNGFFIKETQVYSEILATLENYVQSKLFPKCYYTRPDLMILEDLSACAENFRHTSSEEQYSITHYKVALRNLAKFHAASVAWEIAEGFNIGERYKDILVEVQTTMANDWYVSGLKGIVYLANIHPKFQCSKTKEFISTKLYDILCSATVLTDPSTKYRNVLCHLDAWDKNIFFKFNAHGDPIDCRFVDFQLIRYCPPALDVLYTLYATSSRKMREDIITECIDFYHEVLQNLFNDLRIHQKVITKNEFIESCNEMRLLVLIWKAVSAPLIHIPEGIANKIRTEEPERYQYYMECDRKEMFERFMNVDKLYKNAIFEPIEELMEYLLKKL